MSEYTDRFVVMNQEAIRDYPGVSNAVLAELYYIEETDPSSNAIVELDPGGGLSIIAWDGGDPEDQIFESDLDWICPLLNKLDKEKL